MQNNLVFLCGPHGSGKTTLGREIAKDNSEIMIPELYSRNIKFNTSSEYRLALKICQRSIENFEYLEIAKKNPDKIILGNRCIYDQFAYNLVYYSRGWMSKERLDKYNQISKISFVKELQEPYAVVLNPCFEDVKKHLENRWKEKGKKWREEDMSYLKTACEVYERFQDNENIFYIGCEVDLESKVEIKEAREWIYEKVGVVV